MKTRFTWKAVIGFVMFLLLQPVALFIAAGHVNWPMAWAYAGLLVISAVGSRLLALRNNPDLLAERAQAFERGRQGNKDWDRLLMGVVGLYGPLIGCIVAGLDKRWSWSPEIPPVLRWMSLVLLALSYAWATWAMVANQFFSATVRIQKDRGHTVVTGGPYRFMRHPGYAGGALSYLVAPVMLGSLWAFIPAVLTVSVLVVRTALEDKTLQNELEGYKAYTEKTRYRLLPGVW